MQTLLRSVLYTESDETGNTTQLAFVYVSTLNEIPHSEFKIEPVIASFNIDIQLYVLARY
jgi:hypothetical protein